jgi:hypothetical protein
MKLRFDTNTKFGRHMNGVFVYAEKKVEKYRKARKSRKERTN